MSETFFERKHGENVSLSQAKFPREVTYVYHEVSHELVQIDLWCFFFPVISYVKSYWLCLCMCVGLEAPLKWFFLKLWIIMLIRYHLSLSSLLTKYFIILFRDIPFFFPFMGWKYCPRSMLEMLLINKDSACINYLNILLHSYLFWEFTI